MMSLPCGHLRVNASRIVTGVNGEALRLLDCSEEEVVGGRFSSLLAPGARVFFHTHVFAELELSGRVDELYVELCSSETRVSVLLSGQRRELGDQVEVDFVFLPARRRSWYEWQFERARSEAQHAAESERRSSHRLRTMQEQLDHTERLAELGRLTAGLAHEVNNPLAYVITNLEALVHRQASGAALEQDDVDCAQEALDGARRIADIVADLRLFSRKEPPRRGPVQLQRVVDKALRFSSATVRRLARIELELRSPELSVRGDENRLVQVLVNLLVNAAQAIGERAPQRGTIVVTLDEDSSGAAVISVADDGVGIPSNSLDKVFDPFFTTKPAGSGTGLGLSVCHGIVTEQGGALEVESQVGVGTTFRIRLPTTELAQLRHGT